VTRLAANKASTRHITATLAPRQAWITMMERASIMFPSKSHNTNRQLLAIAVTAMLAACSSNPSGSNGSGQNSIDRGSTTQSASSVDAYRTSNSSTVETTAPVAQLVSKPVPLASGAPDEYTVQVGDTLWDIAATFLRDPWYWPEVWYVNPQIENPHLIYPGDVLALVVIDGQQRVTNVRASTYRLSPAVRVSPLSESIASVPYESVAAFLSQGLVLEASQINDLAYILSIRGDHMIAASGNDIYVRGGQPAATGTRYSLVHVGEKLVDPDDGRTVGYHGIYVGGGAMVRGGDPATVTLTSTNREAVRGDRLISEEVNIPLNFFPKAPDSQIDGQIISVVDGVSLIARYRVVVVNRGASDGLDPGDVLTVFQAGEVVKDPFGAGTFVSKGNLTGGKNVKLPDEKAGTVMVFKVYNRISYALVMSANSEIKVLDALRSPN
jgi:LysM repeat protein